MIELQLKVKHFIELEYKPLIGTLTPYSIAGFDCAIEKALKEQFNIPRVWEGVSYCVIQPIEHGDKKVYKHEYYGKDTFYEDQNIAIDHQDNPEFLIKTLNLIKDGTITTKG